MRLSAWSMRTGNGSSPVSDSAYAKHRAVFHFAVTRSSATTYLSFPMHWKTNGSQFGHKEGDRAFVDFARPIKSSFRESDLSTRLGADEFVVLLLPLQSVHKVCIECQ